MPAPDTSLSDEEYIIKKAKEAANLNSYLAKSWMLTAKCLYPNNFSIQFEAYIMEKQSGNVSEAADCFSSLLSSSHYFSELLPEITAIANALKTSETNFLSQMFDKLPSDIQLTILKTSVENSEDTMEHCRLLVLLLRKFPQLGVDSLVKTIINGDKFFYDNCYARLLVVDTLPLLSSLESPRLLQRLLIKAIDFYNTYVHDETEHDITDPWQRLYGVLEMFGRQLNWDPNLLNYNNSLNKETYFQKLVSLRNFDDCRQLLYCGTIFLLRCLYEQKSLKINHVFIEALTDPELPPTKRRIGESEVTGVCAIQFQTAANCWELLHSHEVISREFIKLCNQLQAKPWTEGFTEELALYRNTLEDRMSSLNRNDLASKLVNISTLFFQKNYSACIESMLYAITILPPLEGALEVDLLVGGTHRHLHFLALTKLGIMHYFTMLLIRILLETARGSDIAYGHILVLMQLSWPQEEPIFIQIMDNIKQKGVFRYHMFQNYIINIDMLEEFSHLWNEQGNNVVLDIIPNSQQHFGQRRIGTRGADKGVKEDFKQAMKSQVARANESVLNLIIQFITQEKSYLLQV